MSIEKVPTIQQSDLLSAIITPPNEEVEEIVNNINSAFEYWDSVKYKECP